MTLKILTGPKLPGIEQNQITTSNSSIKKKMKLVDFG